MEHLAKKLDELGTQISLIQKKNDEFEKKNDSLVQAEVKKAIDAAVKTSSEISKAKEELEIERKRIEQIEKSLAFLNTHESKTKNLEERYHEEFSRFLRTGQKMDENLINEVYSAYVDYHFKGLTPEMKSKQLKDMQVGINPDGGYLVLPQRISQVVMQNFETSPMRAVSNVISTSNESVELIIDDNEGVSGGWVSEVGSRAKTSTPQLGLLTIHTHEQYANPAITQKLLDDAGFNVESWLSQKTFDKFTRDENSGFVSGNGIGKPMGFLSYAAQSTPGTYQRKHLYHYESGTDGDFGADDLILMQNALKEIYQAQAVWMMKRATWGKVIILKDEDDNYLINPQMLFQGAQGLTLLGKSVYLADDMQASGTTGNLSIAYGNFKEGYTIVDRVGVRTLRDPYTNKPYVQYYSTKRVGGDVTNYESIIILKEAA